MFFLNYTFCGSVAKFLKWGFTLEKEAKGSNRSHNRQGPFPTVYIQKTEKTCFMYT